MYSIKPSELTITEVKAKSIRVEKKEKKLKYIYIYICIKYKFLLFSHKKRLFWIVCVFVCLLVCFFSRNCVGRLIGHRTLSRPILSVIILVIDKSDSCFAVVTHLITNQIRLHSVQLTLLINKKLSLIRLHSYPWVISNAVGCSIYLLYTF